MPKFSLADFKGDNLERLRLITCDKLGWNLMTRFATLPQFKKSRFNQTINDYILSLSEDNWEKEILDTFNKIVLEKLLNEEFKPENQFVMEINTDVQDLTTEEQKRKCDEYLEEWRVKNTMKKEMNEETIEV
jgi:hypothetical protein